MSKPFEQFFVRDSYCSYDKFVVEVTPYFDCTGRFKASHPSLRTKQLKFIQDAIAEKLEREQ